MIINQNKINTSHKQVANTCLLSSYSIAGNYFTNQPVEDYFKSYHNHYLEYFKSIGVNFEFDDFFRHQANHINDKTIDNRSGYRKILELHNNSNQEAFINDRIKFKCEAVQVNDKMIITTSDSKFIDRSLIDVLIFEKNIFMNAFYNSPSISDRKGFKLSEINMHSILIYNFDSNFYYHDTNKPTVETQIETNFLEYRKVGDILLYWEI